MKEHIISLLKEQDIPCTDEQGEKLAAYLELLLEKNKVMNLTAIREPYEAARLHILDSAMLLARRQLKSGARLIDVGTGGGLPGMVLAILRPDIKVTLLDSTAKKINFLREVGEKLELTNLRTLCARAEEAAASPAYRECYDYGTARAVSALPVLLEITMPFIKKGGTLFAYKGQRLDAELADSRRAIRILGGGDYTVLEGLADTDRAIFALHKTNMTPAAYPRRYALITSKPL